jgi:hypothetical protein
MIRWPTFLAVLAGCASSYGPVGILGSSADVVGTKLLRPGVIGRSCRSRVFGIPLDGDSPALREAMSQILALDEEGDVVINADVRSWSLLTGIYERRCLEIRGDLARAITTMAVPGPASHTGHRGHQ